MSESVRIDTAFLDALASKEPTPGGGGASAYAGALAAGLASMVGHLTEGKKTYQSSWPLIESTLLHLEKYRKELLALIDEDARAFAPLAATYRMPATTDEERAAKQKAQAEALVGACQPPLNIMSCLIKVIDAADIMARHGSRLAISDAGACAILAEAALQAASLNVYININSMEDANMAASIRGKADALRVQATRRAGEITALVAEKIGM